MAPACDEFAEQRKVRMDIDAALAERIAASFGLAVRDPMALAGGEESAIWAVSTGSRDVVVRIAPRWRSQAELEWVARIQSGVSTRLSTVPAPIPTLAHTFTIDHLGHLVSIQERKAGSIAGAYDQSMRQHASASLAELHKALASLPNPGKRPPSDMRDEISADPADPVELRDTNLDRFERALRDSPHPLRLIHGDYYGRNVLWRGNAISAILDWDELAWGHPGQEIAWSAWEFCQNGPGTALDHDAARDFVNAYIGAGGTVSASFEADSIQFIRRRLRRECRSALAERAAGLPFDAGYFNNEIEAFQQLRGREL